MQAWAREQEAAETPAQKVAQPCHAATQRPEMLAVLPVVVDVLVTLSVASDPSWRAHQEMAAASVESIVWPLFHHPQSTKTLDFIAPKLKLSFRPNP